jgi:hypothetical protein
VKMRGLEENVEVFTYPVISNLIVRFSYVEGRFFFWITDLIPSL